MSHHPVGVFRADLHQARQVPMRRKVMEALGNCLLKDQWILPMHRLVMMIRICKKFLDLILMMKKNLKESLMLQGGTCGSENVAFLGLSLTVEH